MYESCTRTKYTYDADGRRVGQHVSGGANFWYALDLRGAKVAAMDGATNNTWHGSDEYFNGRHVGYYDHDHDLGGSDTWQYYSTADWLGTERLRTDQNDSVVEQCTSFVYGEGQNCTTTGSASDIDPNHFTGKPRDPESGNDYFGARYYSSTLGRFMSADWSATPEGVPYADLNDPQTLNLYAYVANNPVSDTDSDGHLMGIASIYNTGALVDGMDTQGNSGIEDVPGMSAWTPMNSTAQQQMSVSQQGQDFIKAYEQLSLTVYDANPPHGDWTIGYGHKVSSSDVAAISKEQAEKLFSQDVSRMASHVNADLKVSVTQNQFDALVSLRFNAGANALTPPVADLNRTGHATMEDFTQHYITASGVKLKGLELRRAAEWRMFSKGVYDATH